MCLTPFTNPHLQAIREWVIIAAYANSYASCNRSVQWVRFLMNQISPTVSSETLSREAVQRWQTANYYAAFIVLGLASGSLGPTLPGLAAQTGILLGDAGVFFTARSLGYLLGSFQGGRLYDRLRGNRLMAVLLALLAVALGLIPVVPAKWVLVAVILLLGMAEGSIDVGGNTLLVWVHGTNVGPFMNGLHFFWGVGAFLAPIIVAMILSLSSGIAWAYGLLAVAVLPVAVWTLRLPSPFPAKKPASDSTQSTNQILILLIAALWFLYIGTEVTFGGWIYSYVVTLEIGAETQAAYLSSAFWGALTFGRLLAVPVAARVRPGLILLTDFGVALVSSVVLAVLGTQSVALWVGTIGLGLALASVIPTTISFAESRMAVSGRVTSWLFVGGSAGGMTVPWLVGRFFNSVGPRFTMVAIVVDLSLALILLGGLLVYSRRTTPSVGQ